MFVLPFILRYCIITHKTLNPSRKNVNVFYCENHKHVEQTIFITWNANTNFKYQKHMYKLSKQQIYIQLLQAMPQTQSPSAPSSSKKSCTSHHCWQFLSKESQCWLF